MSKSYKVWMKDTPEDWHILHSWRPLKRGDVKVKAGNKFWPGHAIGNIEVEKIGR